MPLPPEVIAAQEKMNQAKDALLADVESGEPYNAASRHALLRNLKRAQDEFLHMVAQLRS
jgi:hypothetical protein